MKDLSKLSLAELRNLETEVNDELKSRHYLDVSKAREQILHIAQSTGMSVKDLLASKAPKPAKTGSVAAKYRNPDDLSQAWSGRGKHPRWVKAWLEAGKSLDVLLIRRN